MSDTSKTYSPEVRERAVRMVLEDQHEHASQRSTRSRHSPSCCLAFAAPPDRLERAPAGSHNAAACRIDAANCTAAG
jgi:transposase-like protein